MMNKSTKTWRYLFKLPLNIYNSEKASYELKPLLYSDQNKVVVFAGKNDTGIHELGVVYVYLELLKELNEGNNFANLQRLLNLIYMETGLPTHAVSVPISKEDDINKVLSTFSSDTFYYPDRSYSGTAPQPNHIVRVKNCTDLLSGLGEKNFNKFDNSLNTYIWALELMELPNPHLKYTLYMTLFLSSINQLADGSKLCSNHPVCSQCQKEMYHQITGDKQATINLVEELLTGNNLDEATKMISCLYSKLRSSFLHSGILSGMEKEGGFLAQMGSSNKVVENMMNVLIMNRQLLEQFLVKRQANL